MPRIIAHVDMDAFFAAIEEREHPAWKGKPIVVGADPEGGRGRGVVSTANYKAREFGIRSAMPISLAWRKCPYAMFVRPRRLYGEVSERIMALLRAELQNIAVIRHCEESRAAAGGDRFAEFTPSNVEGLAMTERGVVEVVSIDEAYLDVSACGSFAAAEKFAGELKETIFAQEKLTASIGVGPNKLIAKIASDFQKPDGLTVVQPEMVEAFLEPLPVRALRGVGPKAEEYLKRMGVQTVRDLRERTEEDLTQAFGVFGQALFRQARGIDEREVSDAPEQAKSIGRQTTFARDVLKPGPILAAAVKLAERVHRDVLAEGVRFKTVTVTCRYAGFETHTKTRTLPTAAQSFPALKAATLKLLWPFLGRRPVRLVGVRVGGLQGVAEGA
ncbi:DNA polymerase IV [Candidatus Parcubacteria bacterium]|nr:DNA polymerase IV [Candidatus Parcubacteria bacterium]